MSVILDGRSLEITLTLTNLKFLFSVILKKSLLLANLEKANLDKVNLEMANLEKANLQKLAIYQSFKGSVLAKIY